MKNNYNIFIDYEEDTFEIIKTPSKKPVQILYGKYGVEFHKDINGHVVKIVIPEPEILFGFPIKDIETFLTVDFI